MTTRRKLIKDQEFGDILGWGHRIEGTRLYVLELLLFGFAYSSYYLLLRSPSVLEKLGDEKIRENLCQHPSRFGRKLEFGPDLERVPGSEDIYYIGEVAESDSEKV